MSDEQTPDSPGTTPPRRQPGTQPDWGGDPAGGQQPGRPGDPGTGQPPSWGAPPPDWGGDPAGREQPGRAGDPGAAQPPGWGGGPPTGGQPGWGSQRTPGGPPPATGVDPKVGGLLSYLFGWIGGLIIYLTQRDRELRFHGAQSILLSIGVFAIYVALWILGAILSVIPVLDVIGRIVLILVTLVLWIPILALFIFMCVKGYKLEHYKLPYIGDMAERWAMR